MSIPVSQPIYQPIYQVDAFTDRPFTGNPAAVCPLGGGPWPSDALMQAVAAENNLSETAFVLGEPGTGGRYGLRWFTPTVEVDLCGHATLATAFVLWERLGEEASELVFETLSGELRVVRRTGGDMGMDFPARPPAPCTAPRDLEQGLGGRPRRIMAAHGNYLVVFETEAEVRALAPDMAALSRLDLEGVIATAPADDADIDFVSRYFAPAAGIPEDPVTGSSHCTLTPYWAGELGKDVLRARQVSARGGEVGCRLEGDRVTVSGRAVLVLEGSLLMNLHDNP